MRMAAVQILKLGFRPSRGLEATLGSENMLLGKMLASLISISTESDNDGLQVRLHMAFKLLLL